ncbi:MAG: nitrogen fixation protein NifZ [Propionivibrio sp.]|jgi:nitrogen fixation protein NifZ|nr:nitrogen fixation protein NifZ [Propionivibrio sp.]
MIHTEYEIGDMVYAAEDILNDGGMPGVEEMEGLIAPAGTRGVVVNSGVAELDKRQAIYLVQFENGPDKTLGDPVGCLPEDLTQNESVPA